MSRSVYRYNVSLCYLYVLLTVSVVSVKRQEVTEIAKSVTETSRTYRNFTMAVLYMSIYFVTVRGKLLHGTLRCLLTALVCNICSLMLKVKVTLEGHAIKWLLASVNIINRNFWFIIIENVCCLSMGI